MARDAAKQLLDELMGRERNLGPNQQQLTLDWNDPSVNIVSIVLMLNY